MNYILSELEKISDPEEKRREAKRLLKVFDSPARGEIPRGIWTPSDYWPELKKTERILGEGEEFFRDLGQIFGENKPEVFLDIYSRFQRNARQMRKLSSLDVFKRKDLPHDEFYPFFEGFNEVIHRQFRRGWHGNPPLGIDNLTFTPEIIGRGGFGIVYYAHDSEGHKFALKLFYLDSQRSMISFRNSEISQTLENLAGHLKDIEDYDGFVKPRFISSDWNSLAHITDFFEGENLRKMMENPNWKTNPEVAGRILSRYAEALCYLHQKGLLLIDHNPGNILVSRSDVKFCDYDFISSKQELEGDCPATKIRTLAYASRENLLSETQRELSDLEGFAMVIHHLLDEKFLLDIEDYDKEKREADIARLNKRKYHAPPTIPSNLKQVMKSVLTYPRDDSIKASDFRQAIREDYGI